MVIRRQAVSEHKFDVFSGISVPATPTSWFWNIRVGDKIRFNDTGAYYTIAGPQFVRNSEGFVNWGRPDQFQSIPGMAPT